MTWQSTIGNRDLQGCVVWVSQFFTTGLTEMNLLVVDPDFALLICLYVYIVHSIIASKSDINHCACDCYESHTLGGIKITTWESSEA